MHENTLRRCLWCGFLILCLGPTLWTLSWIASHQFDFRRSGIQDAWSGELGLDVRIARVTFPRPRQTLLHDVEIRDPETAEVLASARKVEWFDASGSAMIVAHQPKLRGLNAVTTWRWLHERYLRRRWTAHRRFEFYADELTLEPQRQTLSVLALGETSASGPRLDVHFRLAGDAETHASRLRLARRRSTPRPSTLVELACPRPIPCELLRPLVNLPNLFGKRASFQGSISAVVGSRDWQCQLRDVLLREVELETLVQHTPHQLFGIASLRCPRATLGHNRLDAAIELEAGPGHIDASLLQALSRDLNCGLPPRAADAATRMRYTRLGLQLTIRQSAESAQLEIQGLPDGQPQGVLLADEEGSLLQAPTAALGAVQLARFFANDAESRWLGVLAGWPFARFPQSPVAAETNVDGAAPRGKIQLIIAEEEEKGEAARDHDDVQAIETSTE